MTAGPRIVASPRVACGTVVWRRRGADPGTGETFLTVIVKATFALRHGSAALPVSAEEIVKRDRHFDKSPTRSVHRAADTAPYRPRADVTFVGHAHAPAGGTVAAAAVRLALFRDAPTGMEVVIDKTLHVYGDRATGAARPEPFASMPIVWERAAGGPGVASNPVGVDPDQRLPNIVSPSDARRPAGLGPISRYWPIRRDLMDTEQRRALEAAVAEVPEPMRWEYFHSAPEDQRAAHLRGDEWILLDGLHPTLPRVVTRLPGARGIVRVHALRRSGVGPAQELVVVADALEIDGDRQVCSLVWRGHFVVPGGEAGLPLLQIDADLDLGLLEEVDAELEEPTLTLTEQHTDAIIRRLDQTTTVTVAAPDLSALGSALPFAGAPQRNEPPHDRLAQTIDIEPDSEPPAPPPAHAAAPAAEERTGLVDLSAIARPALPFAGAGAVPAAAEPIVRAPSSPPPTPHVATRPPPPASGAEQQSPSIDVQPRTTPAIPIVAPSHLAVATLAWQVRPPVDSITVVVKATADLVADGPARLRAEADPPLGDVHVDEDPSKSLSYASDFAVFKPRVDVTLVGHAYAPGGSAPAAIVEMRFGEPPHGFHHRVAVFGDRSWQKVLLTLAPTDPAPFDRMPLIYERAFGGPKHAPNPVGAGQKGTERADGRVPLPNLELPQRLISSPGHTPPPACFAPVPMMWRERWSKLGAFDAHWVKTRWPWFPEDFDWAFFQAAPPDQQLDRVTGDETFDIAGVRPDAARISGRLPATRVRCFLQRGAEAGGAFEEIPVKLDTLAFDSDAMRLQLCWRGVFEASDEEAPEVAAIFVLSESLADRPLELEDARRRFVAASAPLSPIEEVPGAPAPANDAAPPLEEADDELAAMEAGAAAREKAIMAELSAAGVSPAAPAPPPPPPAPEAIATWLRDAGASAEDVAAVLEAARPPDEEPTEAARPAADVRARVVALLESDGSLEGLDLSGADLSGLDFGGKNLARANLKEARLGRCRFRGADLSEVQLGDADLTDADLSEARVEGADLTRAILIRAILDRALLTGATFVGADGEAASFAGAQGEHVVLADARWVGASFVEAKLPGADFSSSDLERASFRGATMPEVRLYGARGTEVVFDAARLDDARADGARLPRSSFRGVIAPGSVWERAVLDDGTFFGSDLTAAGFSRASCQRLVLSGCRMRESRLRRTRLVDAKLLKTDLMMATLEAADLTRADLRGANLFAAETWKAKLDGAQLDLAFVARSKLEGST